MGSLAQKADREKCDFFVLDFDGRGVSADASVYRSVPFENQSESPESIWLLSYDPNKSAGSGEILYIVIKSPDPADLFFILTQKLREIGHFCNRALVYSASNEPTFRPVSLQTKKLGFFFNTSSNIFFFCRVT